VHGLVRGRPPELDLQLERALQRLLVDLAARDAIASAHDCSEGGLAIALAECCFDTGGIGAEVAVRATSDGGLDRLAATLFGESASRVLLSVTPRQRDAVLAAAAAAGVPAATIGRTGGSNIRISVDGAVVVDTPVAEAERTWATSLGAALDGGRAA
jgi:phosphoribosylformylglycinamidine synthase